MAKDVIVCLAPNIQADLVWLELAQALSVVTIAVTSYVQMLCCVQKTLFLCSHLWLLLSFYPFF